MVNIIRLLVAVLAWALAGAALAGVQVTDLAGRTLEVPEQVRRIVLGESRYLPALAILEGDRVTARLVAMLPDFELTDPGGYRQYLERFPELARIPRVGHASADSFSVETVIALAPDLAIFSLEGHGPAAHNRALIERLERAGVTVVFVDFRQQPLENTPRSMALLGQVLGRSDRAEAFNSFYRQALAEVTGVVAELPDDQRPRVFLHSRVGRHDSCCETMADGMMGHFIEAAGGRNLARERLPGVSGTINLEYLLSAPPDRYVATAIGSVDHRESSQQQPYVVMGAGISETAARESLARAVQRPGLAALPAIRQQRVFALWHHFYNTPLNVVAVQALAKWLHPERLAHLDPRDTLATLYRRFQPVALEGTYWVALAGDDDAATGSGEPQP